MNFFLNSLYRFKKLNSFLKIYSNSLAIEVFDESSNPEEPKERQRVI